MRTRLVAWPLRAIDGVRGWSVATITRACGVSSRSVIAAGAGGFCADAPAATNSAHKAACARRTVEVIRTSWPGQGRRNPNLPARQFTSYSVPYRVLRLQEVAPFVRGNHAVTRPEAVTDAALERRDDLDRVDVHAARGLDEPPDRLLTFEKARHHGLDFTGAHRFEAARCWKAELRRRLEDPHENAAPEVQPMTLAIRRFDPRRALKCRGP